jgi:hypothetical protein
MLTVLVTLAFDVLRMTANMSYQSLIKELGYNQFGKRL